LALLCFALGLMSKPMLVTWPFVMLLLDFWPLRRISDLRKVATEKIPFFLLSVASCAITLVAQEKAVQSLTGYPLRVRMGNALISYVRYLGKTVWPTHLALPYPYPPAGWPAAQVGLAATVVLVVTIGAVWLAKRKPYLPAGWFWFLGTLIPVIGLVQVGGQAMADRYTYLPLIGIFVVVVWGVRDLVAERRDLKIAISFTGTLVLGACAISAAWQTSLWRDSGTLFSHAAAVTDDNDTALANLGNHYLERKELDAAIQNLHRALQTMGGIASRPEDLVAVLASPDRNDAIATETRRTLQATDPKKVATCAEILNNLGTAFALKGEKERGMNYYRAVLQLKPDHALAMNNLAFELAVQNHFAPAIELYRAAARLNPDRLEIRRALADTLMESGQTAEAVREYHDLLQIVPNDPETQNRLGLTLATQGKTADAIAHYQAALRSDPKLIEARNNLGTALISAGRVDEAIQQFREILRRVPDHSHAHDNLGIALAAQGKFAEATQHLSEALRLDPASVNTRFNLGNVLASQGKFKEAVAQYTNFLAAVPDHVGARCNLGGALTELGRRDEAVVQLREALRLEPDNETAKEQLRKLGEK
jgi:tetratricopeptide (TPR) repeat protein